VRINSVNNASISRKKFVKYGPVTPELTELICELVAQHSKTRGSAMAEGAEGLWDALVSRNSATTKHPI